MAVKKANQTRDLPENTETIVDDVVKDEQEIDLSSIMRMLEQQRKTIESLQEQLNKQNKAPVKSKASSIAAPVYDPNRSVAVVNMYDGQSLTLKSGHQGERTILYGYGDRQYFRYEIVANMARMNRSFASKGYFIFEDADIIRDFGLEKDYEKFVDKKIIDSIENLDKKSLVALYSRINLAYQDMICDKFIKGFVDGVKGFRDIDKIEALAEISGRDIQYSIDELQKAKKMQK